MKKEIAALMTGFAVLTAAADSAFNQAVKLKGEKGEKPVFSLVDGTKNAGTVRASGKAWSAVQITREGTCVRLKKDMKQILTGQVALADRSFTFSVWIRPASIQKPFSMIVANTTRPPCWGVRLAPAKTEGKYFSEVFYNWGIKGLPGQLIRAKGDFQTGEWHFYTLTFDRAKGVLNFYIDGQSVGSAKIPKETPAFRNLFTVSCNPWYFDGQVCDLTFRPDVLSADQIAARFKAGENSLKDEKK